jgi:GAF domain-containing protein
MKELSGRGLPRDAVVSEEARLHALQSFHILDTPPHRAFDCITETVALTFDVPIALITLVDRDRQWFKSVYGLDACQTPRSASFCAYTITQESEFVVKNAACDPRFRDNPLVVSDPQIRFYAGLPLRPANGHALGALCIIDTRPKTIPKADLLLLRVYAECVVGVLEAPRDGASLGRFEHAFSASFGNGC